MHREHGHAAVREYWTRQFTIIDGHVEPTGITTEGDRIRVDVHQVVHDLDGNLLSDGHIQHVYSFRDGLVSHMEIREE